MKWWQRARFSLLLLQLYIHVHSQDQMFYLYTIRRTISLSEKIEDIYNYRMDNITKTPAIIAKNHRSSIRSGADEKFLVDDDDTIITEDEKSRSLTPCSSEI